MCFGTNSVVVSLSFGIAFGILRLPYCTRLARITLMACHISGALTDLQVVRPMLGELIVSDRRVRLLALLGGACQFICRCVGHHIT